MITVIGLGFVGLTTALGFAEKGCRVFGIEAQEERVKSLAQGKIPFHEPGLGEALLRNIGSTFLLGCSLEQALLESEYVFICVGTPSDSDGKADLSQVVSAIDAVVELANPSRATTIIVKSTVPPGSTANCLTQRIDRSGQAPGGRIRLANNPEFLREGMAWDDFVNPDRIVIGCNDTQAGDHVKLLYTKCFDAPCHLVSWSTAEFIKYLSNTLLSTLISFSNEMALIANAIGAIDIKRAFGIVHEDKRWSGTPAKMTSYLYPGCGFGGYCLPKDTRAMAGAAQEHGVKPSILKSVLEVNAHIQQVAAEAIVEKLEPGQTLGILGLTFKPGSDDVRESPAKNIISTLLNRGIRTITVFDPRGNAAFESAYKLDIEYASSFEALLAKADVIAILTAWDEFKHKQSLLHGKQVLDFRYCLADMP